MGVAAEISQHLSRPTEGRLGIDYPLDPSQVAEASGEGGGSRERCKLAEEAEFASRKGGTQFLEKQAAEEPREDAHRQEEPRATGDPARVVERRTAAGHDAMTVWMMVQVLAPGVKHRDQADLGAEMGWVGGDRAQCLGRRPAQNGVDRRLVLV